MTTGGFLAVAAVLMFGGLALMIFIFNRILDQIKNPRDRYNYSRTAGQSMLYMVFGCVFLFIILIGYLICEYLLCAASA